MRCLQIPSTDKILWDKIVEILTDTVLLKNSIKQKLLIGVDSDTNNFKTTLRKKKLELEDLHVNKQLIERGLVKVESNYLLNKYTSENVYKSLKTDLNKKYNLICSKIEVITNTLNQIGKEQQWLNWIDELGNQIQDIKNITDIQKKKILNTILNIINVVYDTVNKVHILTIHFRIPVLQDNHKNGKISTLNGVFDPSKIQCFRGDQNGSVENYSTVTDFARFRG